MARESSRFHRANGSETPVFQVFEALPDIFFFVKDRSGATFFCSSHLAQRHGFASPDEMLERNYRDLTPGAMADSILADDETIYRSRQALPTKTEMWLDEVRLPSWHLSSKFPVKNRGGEVIGIMGVLRRVDWSSESLAIDRTLEPSVRILEGNLTEFPGLSALSDACAKPPRQFQRLFSEMFGMGAYKFWMKLRIREARRLLSRRTLSISSIAGRLGFCDQSTFTMHFRRYLGTTPAKYVRSKDAFGT